MPFPLPSVPAQTIAAAAPARLLQRLLAVIALILLAFCAPALAQTSQPKTVNFLSADGKTNLVGYLFAPVGRPATAPAVVLMHGRSGAYSSAAKEYTSVTLSKRIRGWAEMWAQQGYWALVVDSFGPRGFPQGFAAGTDATRPAIVNEVTVRPLDAYGALRYLRTSPRVTADRVALQGWSNGASATLVAMSDETLETGQPGSNRGFRAALALYPGCGLQGRMKDVYKPYAPVHIYIGTHDDEVSLSACQKLATTSKAAGGETTLTVLEGATHDFDDPVRERQQVPANVVATEETRKQAVSIFAAALK